MARTVTEKSVKLINCNQRKDLVIEYPNRSVKIGILKIL